MTATEECAVDSRIADLIKRYGYDAVRASVQKQKPPAERKRSGPKKPRYPIEKYLPWLVKAKESWARDGKPIDRVRPHLMKIAEEMVLKVKPTVTAKSHAARLADQLERAEEIWLQDHDLMEIAKAWRDPFPFDIEQHRRDLIKVQNALCGSLIEKASLLPSARIDEEISDLLDIVNRRGKWREMVAKY